MKSFYRRLQGFLAKRKWNQARYCVITGGIERCWADDFLKKGSDGEWYDDLPFMQDEKTEHFFSRVFYIGELLILDGFGREIGYPERKPDNWGVRYETFSSLRQARKRAFELEIWYPEVETDEARKLRALEVRP